MERLLTGDFLPLSAEWQPIFAVFSALACGACQTNFSGDLSDENLSRNSLSIGERHDYSRRHGFKPYRHFDGAETSLS